MSKQTTTKLSADALALATAIEAKKLETWIATSIVANFSEAKRRNYFRRLIQKLEHRERHLLLGSGWPRLPLDWTPYRTWATSREAGMPWSTLPISQSFEAHVVARQHAGAMIAAIVGFARDFSSAILEYDLLVVQTSERAWIFHVSRPGLDTWTSGEHWQEPLIGAPDYLFIDWGQLRRFHQVVERSMRVFDPHGHPPRSDWAFGPGDVDRMLDWLSVQSGHHPDRLVDELTEAYAHDQAHVRFVPIVFEGEPCFPGAAVHSRKLRNMLF